MSTLVNEDFNNYYDWEKYQIKYEIIKNRLRGLRTTCGYSKELVSLLERMLTVEEYNRISIIEVCVILSQTKFGALQSERTSSVHSLTEEYQDYYGDFDNEMVKNFEENQMNLHNQTDFSPVSKQGYSEHQFMKKPKPFTELTPKEAKSNFMMRKRNHNMKINGFGQQVSPQSDDYDHYHEPQQQNYDPRNFEFGKQRSPKLASNERYDNPLNHQASEYGYYQNQPQQSQNLPPLNYNYEEPQRINNRLSSSSNNLLSGGYRLSNNKNVQNTQDVNFPFNTFLRLITKILTIFRMRRSTLIFLNIKEKIFWEVRINLTHSRRIISTLVISKA